MANLNPEEIYMAGMAQFEGNEFVEQVISRAILLRERLEEEIRLRQIESQKHNTQVTQLEQEIEVVKLERLTLHVNGDRCVVFLINGNDLIFSPVLLNLGEAGGRAAADRLSFAIDKHLMTTLPNLDSNLKIVVRIYANVSNLTQKLENTALVDSVIGLENFIRGFNSHKLCFDFIDIGNGEIDADAKIEALLSFYVGNPQCLQIILGINPWYRLFSKLEKIDCYQFPSIYLVDSTLTQEEFTQLESNIQTVNFDNIFYKNIVDISDQPHQISNVKPGISIWDTRMTVSSDNSIGLQSSTCHSPSSESLEPIMPIKSKQTTWAKIAGTVPPRKAISPLPAVGSRPLVRMPIPPPADGIPRNIYGQRIDPNYPTTQSEWRRIQQLHLCNIHFLRRECGYGNKCTRKHKVLPEDGGLPDGSLSKHDLQILAQVSRYAPCRNGTSCDDVKCTYGHRCPVQENTPQAGNGRECKFGKNCKFSAEMHGVDTEVVNTVEI